MTEKILCKEKLLFQKRWLEYMPDFWNINEIYNKKVSELSEIDLEILLMVAQSKRKIEIIDMAIEKIDDTNRTDKSVEIKITDDENMLLDDVFLNFDINAMALIKLNANELNIVNQIIDKFNGKNIEIILEQISKICSPYVKDYATYCLNLKKEKITNNKIKIKKLNYRKN